MLPRAPGSQYGAPNPASAGTKYTPALSLTAHATFPDSAAELKSFRPSRSHWRLAPAIKIEHSRTYIGSPFSPQPKAVIRPYFEIVRILPVFNKMKQPVP